MVAQTTLIQSDTVHPYGCAKADTRTVGVDLRKKPKDLSVSEREERGHGKGVGVYGTLLQSDTVHPYGRAESDTRSVGFELRKKPKDLSVSEREDRGYGEGVSTENVNESALCTTYDVGCSRKTVHHL
jgi:hypothetical protein